MHLQSAPHIPKRGHRLQLVKGNQPALVGRDAERQALNAVLADARAGRSGVLVLRGEAGVGKSALLDYAIDPASGFQVARAVGVEAERELAYAALQQLSAPFLDGLERLPAPQRDALRSAFGLSSGPPPERFLVGLAILDLLSAAADEQPLVCVVDDAQWLDQASAQALAFVARRLLADRVALLFATRELNGELSGLPEFVLDGLPYAEARALLDQVVDAPLDDDVRDRIVTESEGNPLALIELPRGSAAELAVGFLAPATVPLSGRIEEIFQRRVEALPAASRRLLLTASADALGEPATIWRAATTLGIARDAAAPASDVGLLDIDGEVQFRHPLVRSAVYRGATPGERRQVHKALAEATDPELDPDRRAWHLAAAAIRPDEQIATELEQSAGRAQVRGGLAAAAAFLERSAELTPDPERQAIRLVLAAGAAVSTGANSRAQVLLERGMRHLRDPAARGQALRMAGAIQFADGRGGDTPKLLFDAAMALRDQAVGLARETLLECFESAYWAAGLTTGTTLTDVAEAAREMPAPEGDESTANFLLTGYSERILAGYAEAAGPWRAAIDKFPGEMRGEPRLHWQGLVWNVTGELLDYERHRATAQDWVQLAREHGALATLPVALSGLAWCEVLGGRLEAAENFTAQAAEITAATGAPAVPGAAGILQMGILAWRGRDREARLAADAVTSESVARGQGLGLVSARYALTVLELGLGNYEDARIAGLAVFEDDPLYFGAIGLADIVEATTRAGDNASAHAALARLGEFAAASPTPWALGLHARGRALVTDDAEAEALYRDALDHLTRSGVAVEHARTRLLYGEWLRRKRRRRDARVQLRTAYDMLQAMGIDAFAERARIELLATGEQARARVAETRDRLTPQEHQVAQLAAEGDSNARIGAKLFISSHTVAYHLRKVFSKLGVTSRHQLAGVLGDRR